MSQTIDKHALEKATVAVAAQKIWDGMNDNEKTGVRFGMFPAKKMEVAEAENAAKGEDMIHPRDFGRMLAVALMDCAGADGGMRA